MILRDRDRTVDLCCDNVVGLVFGDLWPAIIFILCFVYFDHNGGSASTRCPRWPRSSTRTTSLHGFTKCGCINKFFLTEGNKKILIHKEKSRFPFSATAHRDFEIFVKSCVRLFFNPETLFTVKVENLHAVSHFKHPTCRQLHYAREFGTTALESAKRMTQWSAFYFTHSTSYFPVPSTQIHLQDFPRMTEQNLPVMSSADQDLMRNWANTHGNCVRQRTVRQETTMYKDGTQAVLDTVHVTNFVQSRHCRWWTDSFTFVRVVSSIFFAFRRLSSGLRLYFLEKFE